MWKILIRTGDMKDFHLVNGMGMQFPGFHIFDDAVSFMLKNLDQYVVNQFGPNAELSEALIKFEDN